MISSWIPSGMNNLLFYSCKVMGVPKRWDYIHNIACSMETNVDSSITD